MQRPQQQEGQSGNALAFFFCPLHRFGVWAATLAFQPAFSPP
jgi:hypothetical protein